MNRRMERLQNELALDRAAPALDAAAIRRRVNASLNADPSERKTYMRQKIKFAAVLAAAVALTGTALAVASQWDALSIFFEGDTSPAAEYLQTPNASLNDGNFKVTLESSVTDGQNVFLMLKVQALTEDARVKMAEPYFVEMETFDFRTIDADGQMGSGGLSVGPLKDLETEDSQTFSLQMMDLSPTTERIYLKFSFLPEDMTLDIPFGHRADTVKLTADFAAKDRNGQHYIFTGITLSPLTFQFHYRNPEGEGLLDPVYFFRMADGSIKTMSQLLDFNQAGGAPDGTGNEMESYTFLSVQDPAAFDAIIVGGKAFPLDGGASEDAAVDPKLYPFRLPLMSRVEEGGALFLPVRTLCEGLGASCVWDSATPQSVTLSYRGVTLVLTLGSKTMLANGERVALDYAPTLENGLLKLNPAPFNSAWAIDAMVLYEGPDHSESEWEVTP